MRIAVSIADSVSLLAFLGALVAALLMRIPSDRPMLRTVRIALACAAALYTSVGVSNVLQWSGVTSAFDVYEDYAELLFLPLVAYSVYVLIVERQARLARAAESAVRAEHELLTTIVDTTPTGLLVVTADGTITFANDIACGLLGADGSGGGSAIAPDPATRIGGQRADWMDARAALAEIASGEVLRDAVRFIMRPDGGITSVAVSTNRIGAGEPAVVVVSLADITERMRFRQDLERTVAERTEELVALNRQLNETTAARREFVAKMSHELRTPLNAVIGFSGILLDGMAGPLSEEQSKQLGMIRRAGRQLLDLVNDVLDISRIESGRTTVSRERVGLADLAANHVLIMRPYAADRSIGLTVASGAPEDVAVVADGGKLTQILRNLTTNAIKFTDPGGHVDVALGYERGCVTMRVSDDGIGIAREDLDRVFEPFVQVETPERMTPQGTGLGLTVTRDLVDLLGGSIDVVTAPGEGAEFIVTIPAEMAPPD